MEGKCKLTRTKGKFVKSHIIPRSFSDLALDKTKRIEFGIGYGRPVLKHTSWYDTELVTETGEAKLAVYDDVAKKEIERLGLAWRFFPLSNEVAVEAIGDTGFEVITVKSAKTKELRIFFLSVLWRAAFSNRKEFRDIRLDVDSREKLRKIVNGEIQAHESDFPMTLLLMTTKGQPQVQSPTRDTMDVPQISEGIKPSQKIFRFFFDGLIVHVGRKKMDVALQKNWGKRCVGLNDELFIIGRPYEGSRQAESIEHFQEIMDRDWPKEAERIYGAL
jgi:hypothetical protein